MAVVAYTIDFPVATGGQTVSEFPDGVRVIKWALASGDTGAPYIAPHRSDKSVQVTGTPGTGTTVRMEGSDNSSGSGEAFGILNAPNMTAASWNDADLTANKVLQILENTWLIRPNFLVGSTATGVVVRMLVTTVARR